MGSCNRLDQDPNVTVTLTVTVQPGILVFNKSVRTNVPETSVTVTPIAIVLQELLVV